MGRPLLVWILASLAFGLVACDVGEFPVDGTGGGGADGGTLPMTFNGQIQSDMAPCMACHGATPVGDGNTYQVTTYQNVMNAVIANDPANSTLVSEMDPNGPPRTEHTPYATATRQQLYTDWINAGAPEM